MRFDTHFTVKIRDAYAARHEPEAVRALGAIVWACLAIFFGIVVIGSTTYGAYEFFRPLTVDTEASTASSRRTISRTELTRILEAFDARAAEYEARRTAPVPVRDPS